MHRCRCLVTLNGGLSKTDIVMHALLSSARGNCVDVLTRNDEVDPDISEIKGSARN